MRDQLKRESRVEFGNHQHWGERWGDAKAVTVGVNQRRRHTVKEDCTLTTRLEPGEGFGGAERQRSPER